MHQAVASRRVGKAHEIIPLPQCGAGRVFPSQEFHTAAKHNEASRPPGVAGRVGRRAPAPPLDRLPRTLLATAALSFLVLLLSSLLAPADRGARTLVAAVLVGAAVA